jgi:hypothetical protein
MRKSEFHIPIRLRGIDVGDDEQKKQTDEKSVDEEIGH